MNERHSSEHLTQSDLRLQQLLRRLIQAGLVKPGTTSSTTPATTADATTSRPHSSRQFAAMLQRIDALSQQVQALQNHTEKLEKQINRSGREQLKTNSLTETQMERLSEALEALRAADARRNDEIHTLHQQIHEQQAAARLHVVQALFPVLDGIDEALRSGRQLLHQSAAVEVEAPPPSPSPLPNLFQRLVSHNNQPPASDAALHQKKDLRQNTDLHQKMESWLVGLTYIQQRLLSVLEAEGVHPIPAEGHPFDPQVHVALEVVAASDEVEAGMVATEVRRGYALGERILRHSEVVVAKEQDDIH